MPSFKVHQLSFFLLNPSPISLAGVHKLVAKAFQLPLSLAFRPEPTVAKTANHKLTLESSKATVFLNHLFPGPHHLIFMDPIPVSGV